MDNKAKIFSFTSPKVQKILYENNIEIVDLLQQVEIDVESQHEANPSTIESDQDFQNRDIATVLLGSSALILSLTPILSKLLTQLAQKPVLVKEMVLVPVEDEKGNVVKDSQGNPILYWAEHHKYVENKGLDLKNHRMNFDGPFGVKVSFEAED